MATQRLSMRKIREILRLRFESKFSYHQIAESCGMGDTTVGECLARAKQSGISWPLASDLDDALLEARLYPPSDKLLAIVQPDYSYVHLEMRKKSVTMQLLWHEYKEAHPGGYQYTQFCHHYRHWVKCVDVTFRNQHKAGERLFVDYAGQTVPIYDKETGKCQHAQIFIATMGASNFTYAEATWTQELPNWIASHRRVFEFLDGAPAILVPDNLKSAVTTACKYDPDINPTYYAMARHYGCAIIPARPYRPRDKAKVECAVLVVERWILAVLRKRTFFSLWELNQAIAVLLEGLNNKPFKKMKGNRRELFTSLDLPALKPLPSQPYELVHFKVATVNINYHIEVDSHCYSVPYTLVQKKVELRFTETVVEILFNNNRVASHKRSFKQGGYTTLPEHMPPSHQKYVQWTPERMASWAGEAGPATAAVAQAIMDSKSHPEQGFKSVLGMIRLGGNYGKDRLERCCEKALTFGSPTYRSIKSMLKLGIDKQPVIAREEVGKAIEHANIRGKEYYQ